MEFEGPVAGAEGPERGLGGGTTVFGVRSGVGGPELAGEGVSTIHIL
jgi:hypothetical protein